MPPQTHYEEETFFAKKWITLRDAISKLPPLDAKEGKMSERISIHGTLFQS